MKLFVLSSLAGACLMLAATLSPESPLEKQASVLKAAKTLKVAYTLRIAGVKSDYTLTYSKPNLLMIDGADRLIESDGNTIWEYNKTAKTYTETPATPELLAKRALSDEAFGWASFFTDEFMKNVADVRTGASRPIKGQPATEVTFTYGSVQPRSATLYVDDKLGIARGFAFKTDKGDILAMADKIETGADAMTADKFAFSAPAGATKAVAPAADETGFASVQKIFASNCTPCHNGRGKAQFSVDSYQSIMKGSEDGPVVTPGDPDNSLLVKLITGQANPKMPPQRTVAAADVDKIKAWIKAGAKQ